MKRVYNFSAGPAILPESVLSEAANEMLCYKETGMSVMEISHRSSDFKKIIESAETSIRDLLEVPNNYKILFLQGGASQQFAMVPMNLMQNRIADYIITGQWAKKAYSEAKKFGKINCIASSEDKNFSYIPDCSNLTVNENSDYVYICENNTIYGTQFNKLPNTKGKILISDMSSCFMSKPIDISQYGLIFAGAQKNIGPAGVTVVIIREDLVKEDVLPTTPTMLKYITHVKSGSLYNTPPAYGIYICDKVFKWIKSNGGISAIHEKNLQKAKLLYDFLDDSDLFKGTAKKDSRSIMNVTFTTGNNSLDKRIIDLAAENGLVNLKGHRTVGGLRASIYNAMPIDGVRALVDFLSLCG